MKKWNEMTLKEKVEYDRKDLLAIEESINANISELERFNKRIVSTVGYIKTKLNRVDNDVYENEERNKHEHSVMTNLIIGSFVIHILLIIYLIIKGV